MKITLGNRQSSVTLTTEQDQYVREVVKRATGSALRSMERLVSEMASNARARWPIGTNPRQKRSRDQIVEGIRIVSDSQGPYVGGYIGNDASWAYYIKSKKVPKFGSEAPVTLSPPLPLEEEFGSWTFSEGRGMELKGNHAFSELIRKPFKSHLPELADELQRETARLARSL